MDALASGPDTHRVSHAALVRVTHWLTAVGTVALTSADALTRDTAREAFSRAFERFA